MTGKPRRSSAEIDDLIAGVIGEAAHARTAYELITSLANRKQRIAPTQVYRALNRLIDRGRVRRVETSKSYLLAAPETSGSLVILCRSCRQTLQVDCRATMSEIAEAGRASDFQPDRIIMEVEGKCPACRAAAALLEDQE